MVLAGLCLFSPQQPFVLQQAASVAVCLDPHFLEISLGQWFPAYVLGKDVLSVPVNTGYGDIERKKKGGRNWDARAPLAGVVSYVRSLENLAGILSLESLLRPHQG